MLDAGIFVITSFISPFISDRNMVRQMFSSNDFVEVFVDTPIEVAESRDPKGLYKKAREGKISNFTGISSPYEIPTNPEIILNTDKNKVEENILELLNYIIK